MSSAIQWVGGAMGMGDRHRQGQLLPTVAGVISSRWLFLIGRACASFFVRAIPQPASKKPAIWGDDRPGELPWFAKHDYREEGGILPGSGGAPRWSTPPTATKKEVTPVKS